MNIWLDMFKAFFCIGGLTFGGGYAMLPMLEREIVEKRHWATSEQLLDYYAVGQCTPGVIAVNVATMIGFNQKRYLGAAVCTFGVVAPSLIIIMLIAGFLQTISGIAAVSHAFGGIRVAVCVLILGAVMKLFGSSVKDNLTRVIFAATFLVMVIFDISPIIVVVIAGIIGYIAKLSKIKEGE
ncbi:MAG: chromate transporter [Oscillospiraceae bacterium]|nr:chromate transporter [Oscillospiraceae bacterium]